MKDIIKFCKKIQEKAQTDITKTEKYLKQQQKKSLWGDTKYKKNEKSSNKKTSYTKES